VCTSWEYKIKLGFVVLAKVDTSEIKRLWDKAATNEGKISEAMCEFGSAIRD
jgi:hypothetical protein